MARGGLIVVEVAAISSLVMYNLSGYGHGGSAGASGQKSKSNIHLPMRDTVTNTHCTQYGQGKVKMNNTEGHRGREKCIENFKLCSLLVS